MLSYFYRILRKIEANFNEFKVETLKREFKYCGKNVSISHKATIVSHTNFIIGNESLVAEYTQIFAGFGVTVGERTMISSGCGISSINHEILSTHRRASQNGDSKPVKIGNNVWIGMNVCVLPGVEIGDNSIVGAGSVVTKNIPSNEIWVGNPARFVQKIEWK